MQTKVAIIGKGWVGNAMKQLFPDAYVYSPSIGTKEEVNQCDVAFICVPSPLQASRTLDTSIVEECVRWLKTPLIIVRSTVNPGTCDYLMKKYNKRIVMQPEYLGETPNHPLLNQKLNEFMIIGGKPKDRRDVIAYNANIKIRQVTALEAEIIKLSENRAIAFKVMECQELYDACEKAGVDYYTVRDAVYGDDPRFNLWFTFIYKDKRGFNSSKCLVKDVPAWATWAEKNGFDSKITKLLVERSNNYARR
jgi:UDPglucose 6-dehydrogenase